MAVTLRGTLSISEVADFLESITRAFYQKDEQVRDFEVAREYWDGSGAEDTDFAKRLPSYDGSLVRTNYRALVERNAVGALQARASEFVVAIGSRVLLRGMFAEWHNHLVTRAVNKTMLEDAVSGQTIRGATNEIVICTWMLNAGRGWLDSFTSYRDELVRQAQRRLDQSVSGAAYKMLKDLS